jgi:nucleosome-remodeling factor subunit BPTF
MQKILTTSGQIITQPVQNNVISSANLQQLLQRGTVQSGQKIVVQSGPGGVQKLLVASPQAQQQQTGEKRIIIQNAQGQQQQIILQSPQNSGSQQQQQIVSIGGQKLILQTQSSPQVQQIKTVSSPGQSQQIQFQIQESPQTQQGQQQQQQIIVQNNGNIAQINQGKFQVMNINGQQVLVKTTNQPSMVVKSPSQITPVKQIQQTVVSLPNQQQTVVKTVQMPTMVTSTDGNVSEQAILAGHPPGTILKCVTAQVVQTGNGPRIVLQGLNDTKLDAQQTQLIQQQVKQQLMKGEEV